MTPPEQNSILYWLPLITAVLGFVSGGFTEWMRDRRAYKREQASHKLTRDREREARNALRRDQLLERRANFQRETLLELQEELAKLVRATGEGNHLDNMAERAGGNWQKQLYPPELDSRIHSANVKTLMLGIRVRDAATRNMVDELRKACIEVTLCLTKAESERAVLKSMSVYAALNNRIGELLRKLDDEEASTEGPP